MKLSPKRTPAAQDDAKRDFVRRKDPRSYPKVDFPEKAQDGYYSYINSATNEISFRGFDEGKYVTQALCSDFQAVDEENDSLEPDTVLPGMGATFFVAGPCVKIVSINMNLISFARSHIPKIDVTVDQSEMGTIACRNAGHPLKDVETRNISKSGGRLIYKQHTWGLDRPLCSSLVALDAQGNRILISSIAEGDRATIYHYGNTVTKIVLTAKN